MSDEAIGQAIGIFIAVLASGWVRYDASRRGLKRPTAIAWSVGVLLALAIFLPLYWLIVVRSRPVSSENQVGISTAPIAGVPCLYCGFENAGAPDFCAKCGRMLRSSTEIHR